MRSKHGPTPTREEKLNAVHRRGESARRHWKIHSDKALKILKYSISLQSAFHAVRNNRSLAPDNRQRNRQESVLLIKNISALVKFVESIEEAPAATQDESAKRT
ncbi:hypothetical protein [Hymenobacter wooponensis]|uniref:Uncharacterized protein n=1 Tax=Hymenobacter wooponensis TaxID=1525360 RepID=A0A4Z0MDV9_9BACT|nr:hypothetical protein [Hymenobacter wooponensis]TGD77684.1 hypothetical protein EU557_23215 [Hymenobacter wooponensis]